MDKLCGRVDGAHNVGAPARARRVGQACKQVRLSMKDQCLLASQFKALSIALHQQRAREQGSQGQGRQAARGQGGKGGGDRTNNVRVAVMGEEAVNLDAKAAAKASSH